MELAQRTRRLRSRLLRDARDEAERAAAWRRLTLTDYVCALTACRAGQVVDAVVKATRLVEDRRAHLRDAADVNTAKAQSLLGETLLEAGHPLEASFHLHQAHRIRRDRLVATGYAVQHDLACLARAALDSGDTTAEHLLADAAAGTDWFAERVSFRLGYDVRRWHARALAAAGQADRAAQRLRDGLDQLADKWGLPSDDPLILGYLRDLGAVLLRGGDAGAAWACLGGVREREEANPALSPADQVRTLVLLARCAERLRDDKSVEAAHGRIAVLADRIDPAHQVLLVSRHDQAVRQVSAGRLDLAAQLLAPVLDRRPLAHGRPALGDGHRLLEAARQLAARAGLAGAPPSSDPGHDALLADI